MSTLSSTPTGPGTPGGADPFRYGWRCKTHQREDGTVETEEVPLTLEDVLHPEEGDVILESLMHDRNRHYIAMVTRNRLANDPEALVGSDLGIYWDIKELRHHSPDVSVIFGVRRQRPDWSSFDVAEEGTRPFSLVEITSPSTRSTDIETKVDHYHRAGVQQYVIVDQEHDDETPRLIDYHWAQGGFVSAPLDPDGRVLLERLEMRLGVRGLRVVLYDADTNEELGDYETVARQVELAAETGRILEEQLAVEVEARHIAEQQARLNSEARRIAEEQARIAKEDLLASRENVQSAQEQARLAQEGAIVEAHACQVAEKQARAAEEARQIAEKQTRLAEERARANTEARQIAEQLAETNAEARRVAEERALTASEARRVAEERARADAEARRRAEERADVSEERARAAAAARRVAEEANQALMVKLQQMEAELHRLRGEE